MKKLQAISYLITVLSVLVFITACNQSQTNTAAPQVGEIDSSAIASDTLTQMAIESSYEYANTITIHKNLVFDIMAYGGPAAKGEFAIIRRGADNKPDTVAHGVRLGAVVNSFTADLDNNQKPEIYIALKRVDTAVALNLLAFEVAETGKALELKGNVVNLPNGQYKYARPQASHLQAVKLVVDSLGQPVLSSKILGN